MNSVFFLNYFYYMLLKDNLNLLVLPRRIHFRCCLSASNFLQRLPSGFARNFQGRLAMSQWTNDQILAVIRITVWKQGLFSGFVPTGWYGKWYQRTATLQCRAYTSRHRHSNYNVIMWPALGAGMHCPSASSYLPGMLPILVNLMTF